MPTWITNLPLGASLSLLLSLSVLAAPTNTQAVALRQALIGAGKNPNPFYHPLAKAVQAPPALASRPLPVIVKKAVPVVATILPTVTVRGLITLGTETLALVHFQQEDELLRVGDQWLGVRVMAISSQKGTVSFQEHGQRVIRHLEEQPYVR